jgi:PKD repeat protein
MNPMASEHTGLEAAEALDAVSASQSDDSKIWRRFGRKAIVATGALTLGLLTAQLVFAAPPVADFRMNNSTASSITVDTGATVSLQSTASDPDDDIAELAWDFDYDGSFEVDASGPTTSVEYATAGSRSIALRVRDTAGDPAAGGDGTVDESLRVKTVNVVVPNSQPIASDIVAARVPPNNGDVAVVGQTISFNGTGSDPDGDPITFEWSFGDGGTALGQNVTHTYASHGSKSVTLTVRDNRGATATRTESVLINAVPVADAHILNASAESGQKNDVPLVGQAYVFTGGTSLTPGSGSTDAEGGTLAYAWDLDNNGTFEVAGRDVASPAGLRTAGTKTVRLRVTDTANAANVEAFTFRVNTAPAAGFAFEPPAPTVGKQILFSSTSSDPDGTAVDPLTFAWDLDGDNAFGSADSPAEPTSPNTPPVIFNTPGEKSVRLRVTDTGGISRTITRTVLVQLSVPTGSFTAAPGAPLPNEAIAFRSTSVPSEPAKQITKVEWDFDYDAGRDTFAPGDVDATGASASHAFSSSGPKPVAMKVTEGPQGGFDIVVQTIEVNAPPDASFRIAPASPLAGDPVTLSSTASDPDGPLAGQDWDLDADGQFDDASGAVASRSFAVAGTYRVALRVTDAKGATRVATGDVRVAGRPLPPPPPGPRVLPGVAIQISGRTTPKGARVTMLKVRAPKGARVKVTCTGKRCPKRSVTRKVKNGQLRFKVFERRLRAGIRITVVVSMDGFVSRYTRFTIRRGRPPSRADRCVAPGATKPTACPAT